MDLTYKTQSINSSIENKKNKEIVGQPYPVGRLILETILNLSQPLEVVDPKKFQNETLDWRSNQRPIWSRLRKRNSVGNYRNALFSRYMNYDIEIPGRLWSLWGSIHLASSVFDVRVRDKQFLACNVMACCAAKIHTMCLWSSQALDTIVMNGDKYHRESFMFKKPKKTNIVLENLNTECYLESIPLLVHITLFKTGNMYCKPTKCRVNLAQAIMEFLDEHSLGILQCKSRSLAIGRSRDSDGFYFIFDCQSRDHPLFLNGEGGAYILRTKYMQVLLYCIVSTMNVPYFNVPFTLHNVHVEKSEFAGQSSQIDTKNLK